MEFANITAKNKKFPILPEDLGFIEHSHLESARTDDPRSTDRNLYVRGNNFDQQNEATGGLDVRLNIRLDSKPSSHIKPFRQNCFEDKSNFPVIKNTPDTNQSPQKKSNRVIGKPTGKKQKLSEQTSFNSLRSSMGSFMVPKRGPHGNKVSSFGQKSQETWDDMSEPSGRIYGDTLETSRKLVNKNQKNLINTNSVKA